MQTVQLNLGCFNCGVHQDMLSKDQETAGSFRSIPKRSGSAGSASLHRFRRFRFRGFRRFHRFQFEQVPFQPVRLHRASLPVPVPPVPLPNRPVKGPLVRFGTFLKAQHRKSLSRVLAKGVAEQDLHMVTLCEVGGHKQGLKGGTVSAQDIVSQVLAQQYKAISCQAYMTTWQAEDGPTKDSSVTLTLLCEPEVVVLPTFHEQQLVIMLFSIAAAEHPETHGLLISGNLHIRIPTNQKVNVPLKKRIAKAALEALEERASTASSGASQPTAPVIVLTGDVSLDKPASDTIVQKEAGEPSVETQWQVKTSDAGKSGDVLFIKGAFGEAFDVSVGASYADRGIRKDQHDFFGVALSIPMLNTHGPLRLTPANQFGTSGARCIPWPKVVPPPPSPEECSREGAFRLQHAYMNWPFWTMRLIERHYNGVMTDAINNQIVRLARPVARARQPSEQEGVGSNSDHLF